MSILLGGQRYKIGGRMKSDLKPMSQFLLYTSPNGNVKLDVFLQDETLWLTQKMMAELFGIERSVITKHLHNVFESSELQEKSVSANFAHTAKDGKIYNTAFYNLDAIISVGYRVLF